MTEWFDNHCHLYENAEEEILKARESSVVGFINVGTDIETSLHSIEKAKMCSDVWATAGVHPHEAQKGTEGLSELLVDKNVVAVGEAGLDFHYDHSPRKAQKRVFAEQIQMARIQKGVDRYTSPNSTDLLARIPIEGTPQMWNKPVFFKNEDKEATARKYFGPVKLTKFHVRLLNDKGFEVNLNDQDWSFSILVTHMYQY